MQQTLTIAVGVIYQRSKGTVFITQRPGRGHLAGYWEFPGGKVEDGESIEQGLFRELDEEVGITVIAAEHIETISYDYPERSVTLYFYLVTEWQREPYGKERQSARWVKVPHLMAEEFPVANQPIIELLKERFST